MRRVLVVDDDAEDAALLERLLRGAGHEVDVVRSGAAIEEARRQTYDVVLLDVGLPDGAGPELLPTLLDVSPDAAVIVITDSGSTDLALECIRAGATDFVQRRDVAKRVLPAIAAATRGSPAERPAAFETIVSRSSVMRNVFHMLQPALQSRVPVLIRGESGTGKELVARALHEGGPRRAGPFVAVNCAGIPETLLEAELFGYERGAFTGAVGRKPGRFDLAQGGTLLLDEVGELHPALQAKLLRVLQEGEYQRLGGIETLQADVRVVSATHRDLEADVESGRFRQDLYYRLAVFTVDLPPLRHRLGDIPLLVEHFVASAAAREHRDVPVVEPMVLDLLASYSFPGNVRQLQNVVTHAVVSSRGSTVRVVDLPAAFLRAVAAERGATPLLTAEVDVDQAFPTLRDVERRHVVAALERAGGNKALAARLRGISRMTLYRKLQEFDLDGG